MDISGLLEEKPQQGRLRELTEAAGRREESWTPSKQASGKSYQCEKGELHLQINTEFWKEYGSKLLAHQESENRGLGEIHDLKPILVEKGAIAIKKGMFALVIPLPFEDCEVHYRPDIQSKDHRVVEWRDPILLPENSVLDLAKGRIKLIMHRGEYKATESGASDAISERVR